MTSSATLANHPGAVLFPSGISSHLKRRVGVQKEVGGVVLLCTVFFMKRRDEAKYQEYSTGAEFVEDLIEATDGELTTDAEFVHSLVVDSDVNATKCLGDDTHWARPRRRGSLIEDRCEECV